MVYGLIITLSAGTLMLALSSLSRRSIYVGLAWAGFCFLTLMLSGILIGVRIETDRSGVVRAGIERWIADHPPPAGLRMRDGWAPVLRFVPPRGGGPGGRVLPERDEAAHPAPFTPAEEAAAER